MITWDIGLTEDVVLVVDELRLVKVVVEEEVGIVDVVEVLAVVDEVVVDVVTLVFEERTNAAYTPPTTMIITTTMIAIDAV